MGKDSYLKDALFRFIESIFNTIESLKRLLHQDTLAAYINRAASSVLKITVNKAKAVSAQMHGASFGIYRLFGLMLFMLIVAVYAQAQPDTLGGGLDFSSPDAIFTNMDAVYGALVVIGGYLSAYIPFLKKIENTDLRVLAWALVTGVGFFFFGSKVLPLALTYAVSTRLYAIVLKWFMKSPQPAKAAT